MLTIKIAPIPAKRLTQPKSVFLCHLSSTNRCHGSVCFTTERLSKDRWSTWDQRGAINRFWHEKDGNSPTVGKGNGAGLDATPAAWDAIGIGKGDPARGKVKVDFELIARE